MIFCNSGVIGQGFSDIEGRVDVREIEVPQPKRRVPYSSAKIRLRASANIIDLPRRKRNMKTGASGSDSLPAKKNRLHGG